MKKIYACLIVAALLGSMTVQAQVQSTFFAKKDAFSRYSELRVSERIPVKTMQRINVQALLNEDKKTRGMMDRPFRFGYGFDVNYKLDDGVWKYLDNVKVWSLKVTSSGAYSLNFIFKDLFLAKGAKLYIFNPNGSMVYGPVTEEQNPSGSWFLSDLVAGEEAIIQLIEPIKAKKASSFTISRIVHGYVYTLPAGALNTSASCNIDINCHADWKEQADAAALVLLSSGDTHCSGSLLNNTNQDHRPFFLSAFHCIDSNQDGTLSSTETTNVQNWAFRFNYEKTTCGGSTVTTFFTYNSANFRAAWVNTDFLLMELVSTAIQTDNRVTFAGWDRSQSIPASGGSIHHPVGDVKKISLENDIFSTNTSTLNYGSGRIYAINSHWIVNFDEGIVQPGSSGSPLFDQSRRVVGQLHGNTQNTGAYCSQPRAEYGRFNLSWTGGGTNSTRLSNWLDPDNTGASVLDISCRPINLTNQTISTTQTYNSCEINVQNVTVTSSANVTMTTSGTVTLSPNFHAQTGSTVHIIATPPSGSLSLVSRPTEPISDTDLYSTTWIEDKTYSGNLDFSIYPNPNNGNFVIELSGEAHDYTYQLFNSVGILIDKSEHNEFNRLNINRSNLPRGYYFVRITMGTEIITKKLVVQ